MSRRHRLALRDACNVLWLLVGLALPALARADDARSTRAQLAWDDAESGPCTSSGALIEREVEELAGHAVFVEQAAADVIVRGGIEATSDGLRAWFEARASDGQLVGNRELSGSIGDCAALRHTLSLVLTILLDRPLARLALVEQADAPAASAHRLRWGIGSWLGLITGALPQAAPGVGLVIELGSSPYWRVRSEGAYWLPARSDGRAGVDAKLFAVSGGLSLCPRLPLGAGRLALFGCGGGHVGAISATPTGLDGPRHVSRLLAQASAEIGLSVRVQRITSLFVSVGAAMAITRPRFFYDRDDGTTQQLFRPAAAGVITRVGLTIGRP